MMVSRGFSDVCGFCGTSCSFFRTSCKPLSRHGAEVLPVEGHVAGVGLEQAQDQLPGGRLPAPRLTDDAHRLPGSHAEADIVDGQYTVVEPLAEVFGQENGRGHEASASVPVGLPISTGTRPLTTGHAAQVRPRPPGPARAGRSGTPRWPERSGGERAALVNGLARGRGLAGDGLELTARSLWRRHGSQQTGGVGMGRLLEHGYPGALLHQAAGVHDGHSIGHLPGHADVVGDEQQAHSQVGLEAGEQIEHLGLDGDVEGGRRFVGHEHLGLAGDGDGDERPLPHPPGKLMGVGAHRPGRVGRCPPGPASRSARSRAAFRPCSIPWRRSTSAIWEPTRRSGSSEPLASWGTRAMARPRSDCMARSSRSNRSTPPSVAFPEMSTASLYSRSTDRALTDLPLPDSPSSTSVLPASTVKLMPRTASTALRLDRNVTARSSTRRVPSVGAGAGRELGTGRRSGGLGRDQRRRRRMSGGVCMRVAVVKRQSPSECRGGHGDHPRER